MSRPGPIRVASRRPPDGLRPVGSSATLNVCGTRLGPGEYLAPRAGRPIPRAARSLPEGALGFRAGMRVRDPEGDALRLTEAGR